MKFFSGLLFAFFIAAPLHGAALECPEGTTAAFEKIARGQGNEMGESINATYQAAQSEAVSKAFKQVKEFFDQCTDDLEGTFLRASGWVKTPKGPANACTERPNGKFHCKLVASKATICCVEQ